MLDLSWKVFSHTGNVDTYLLIKELERDSEAGSEEAQEVSDTEMSIDSSSK
ncbi:YqzL family protein [Alkalicoccobacillus porphyridii]|uniref:YqzL family protein n=1 Tax=Alkalicoccobacillus porphyridii TaxID=2597270 RepID=A0A553ZZ96_9BACI|nr:YqzL family protein [Alkalicoccobacillus porphyridii]TSB46755.1 YqzL family protein [Alkalicoccobacillus porphyridii]